MTFIKTLFYLGILLFLGYIFWEMTLGNAVLYNKIVALRNSVYALPPMELETGKQARRVAEKNFFELISFGWYFIHLNKKELVKIREDYVTLSRERLTIVDQMVGARCIEMAEKLHNDESSFMDWIGGAALAAKNGKECSDLFNKADENMEKEKNLSFKLQGMLSYYDSETQMRSLASMPYRAGEC